MASPHWLLPPLHSPAASSKTGPCFGCGGTRQLAPASSLLCPVSQRDDWSAAPFCWPGPEDCRHLGARRQVAGIRQERAHCPLPTEPPGHLLSPCCMETQWRPRGQGSGGERSVPSSRSPARPRLPREFRTRQGGEGLGLARGARASAEMRGTKGSYWR